MTVLSLDHERADDARLTGGKAATAARLRRAGLPVPAGFVVGPDDDDAAVVAAWRELGGDRGDGAVAVRSSAGDEDGAVRSFAGQYVSVLDVRGREALLDAVRTVRAGVHGPAVRAYLGGRTTRMHVLVQGMVRPVWSGVAFSADPVGARAGAIVEAVPGHLERLVQGSVVPEHVEMRDDGVLRLPGDHDEPVPQRLLDRVVALTNRVRTVLAIEVDVEWALDAVDQLVLLQARPATTSAGGDHGVPQ